MDPVDLLVFGPHPDDLEIGLGATVAKHVAGGHRVGLCDLTAGEMGNGTVEERLAEAEAARAVLGAIWRVNLRWPDRGIGASDAHVREAAALIRTARPRSVAPCIRIAIPITLRRAECSQMPCSTAGCDVA
jgi:LmbE family N-acetylglucosaminyl deacetylase